VTKKEIVKEIADRANLTQLKTKEIVQWTFDAIVKTLTEDGRIELRNFGVFEVKRRKPRKARNPRTGARVDVDAKNVVTFKPGKKMEEEVGQMTTLPHLDQPVKRAKPDLEADGNGADDHEEALETVGGARPRKG
jgi:integration host factor subunit beta